MIVRWLTAFLDLPAPVHEAGTRFWLAATGTTLSPPRGEAGQFATLVPSDGDAYLKVQRRPADAPARVHLDLHVDDVAREAARAEELGARRLMTAGHVVFVSPGGFVFCLVSHRVEARLPAARDGVRLDQVMLDAPRDVHEAECAFWSALTGWEHRPETPEEFSELVVPAELPLRVLVQRLEEPSGEVRAHLDWAAGGGVADEVARQVALGAVEVGRRRAWVVLRDPAGLPSCVTAREPGQG